MVNIRSQSYILRVIKPNYYDLYSYKFLKIDQSKGSPGHHSSTSFSNTMRKKKYGKIFE